MRLMAGTVMVGLALVGILGGTVFAQDAVLSPDQLDQLIAPLALYPDPLVAEITAAATIPDQIVVADRDLEQGMSVDDIAEQGLDASVQALAHYPTLLKWLDDNLPWTTQLGQAFATQQTDVMDAIQRLRARAQSLGNLQDTPQETVAYDGGDIEIEPADPEDIYVPEYDPNTIYYTPGVYATFGIGLPVGLWWRHDWDWRHHEVLSWDRDHPRPHDWWTRPPAERHNFPSAHVWHPTAGRVAAIHGDRGYPRPTAPPRQAARPTPFRPAAPQGRAPSEIRQSGPTRGAEPFIPKVEPTPRTSERAPRTLEPAPRRVEPTRTFEPAPRTVEPTRQFDRPARAVETPRALAPPVERAMPVAPARSSGGEAGMFGGASSRQTQSFSSRGAESRGVSTPVSGGFHGGGAPRGGSQKR